MDPFAKTRLKYTTHLQSTGTALQEKEPSIQLPLSNRAAAGEDEYCSTNTFGDLLNVEPTGIALV